MGDHVTLVRRVTRKKWQGQGNHPGRGGFDPRWLVSENVHAPSPRPSADANTIHPHRKGRNRWHGGECYHEFVRAAPLAGTPVLGRASGVLITSRPPSAETNRAIWSKPVTPGLASIRAMRFWLTPNRKPA